MDKVFSLLPQEKQLEHEPEVLQHLKIREHRNFLERLLPHIENQGIPIFTKLDDSSIFEETLNEDRPDYDPKNETYIKRILEEHSSIKLSPFGEDFFNNLLLGVDSIIRLGYKDNSLTLNTFDKISPELTDKEFFLIEKNRRTALHIDFDK